MATVSVISPHRSHGALARAIIGTAYREVYVYARIERLLSLVEPPVSESATQQETQT